MATRSALVSLSDTAVSAEVVDRLERDGVVVSVADGAIERESGALDILITDVVSPAARPFAGSDPAAWFAGVRSALTRPLQPVSLYT